RLRIYFYKHKIKSVETSFLSPNSTKSPSINSTLICVQFPLLFQSNKNKVSQLGHSPKPLENLIPSILQPFLFIRPRHQCYHLNMCCLGKHVHWLHFLRPKSAVL